MSRFLMCTWCHFFITQTESRFYTTVPHEQCYLCACETENIQLNSSSLYQTDLLIYSDTHSSIPKMYS